jgi:hypothetical protein
MVLGCDFVFGSWWLFARAGSGHRADVAQVEPEFLIWTSISRIIGRMHLRVARLGIRILPPIYPAPVYA